MGRIKRFRNICDIRCFRNKCDIVEEPNSSTKHGVRVKVFSLRGT